MTMAQMAAPEVIIAKAQYACANYWRFSGLSSSWGEKAGEINML